MTGVGEAQERAQQQTTDVRDRMAIPPRAILSRPRAANFLKSRLEITVTKRRARWPTKPTIVQPVEDVVPIAKPSAFSLEKFKTKRAAAIANVETLQTGLPHHRIAASQGLRPAAPGRRRPTGRPSYASSTCRSRGRSATPCT